MSQGLCAERGQARRSPHFSDCSDPAGRKLCPGAQQSLSAGSCVGGCVALGLLVNLSVPLSSQIKWGNARTFLTAGLRLGWVG